MEELIKLESMNCWAGTLGIMPCDDMGLPIMEESKSWVSLTPEFYQQLSLDDKDRINTFINNKTNN